MTTRSIYGDPHVDHTDPPGTWFVDDAGGAPIGHTKGALPPGGRLDPGWATFPSGGLRR